MMVFDNQYKESDAGIRNELRYAMECNAGDIKYTDIKQILGCVCGENDDRSWHWLVETTDGKLWYVSGGCDYTGWDCQSHLVYVEVDKDKPQLAFEEYDNYNRPIREYLTRVLIDVVVENEVLKDG